MKTIINQNKIKHEQGVQIVKEMLEQQPNVVKCYIVDSKSNDLYKNNNKSSSGIATIIIYDNQNRQYNSCVISDFKAHKTRNFCFDIPKMERIRKTGKYTYLYYCIYETGVMYELHLNTLVEYLIANEPSFADIPTKPDQGIKLVPIQNIFK